MTKTGAVDALRSEVGRRSNGSSPPTGWIGRPQALLGAAILPVAVSALLGTLRGPLANTSAALILVLVVVAAASTGYRSAGLLAAVAAGVAFDFFLTAPYLALAITDPADIETAVMLLVVGAAVTEVVQWGRRWQRQVRDRDAYLSALLAISGRDRTGDHGWIDAVGAHLVALLHLDRCVWADSTDPREPRLEADGEVRHGGRLLRVDDDGLPVDSTITVPIDVDDLRSPGFVLTAAAHVARPTLRQRRLARALADQTGWALRQDQVV